MANTVLNLVDLDFNKFKETLRTYAKEQALFKDYDFDGSNMSVLNDILAYNTYHNAFYLNMLFAEMFLDSAQLRNSIASHAKDLNYLPRSFRSSKALVDIQIRTDGTVTSVTIPKNQPFSTRVNSKTFQFVTAENIVAINPVDGVFTAKDVSIYEGNYVVDTFYSNYALDRQRFVLSNPTIDTTSLTVVVTDDEKATTYELATSFLGITETSEVFFLQPAEGDRYEIVFGNDIIGKKPKNGATIFAEYRVCNGELPNGAFEFANDRNIGLWGDVEVITQLDSSGNFMRAVGGSVHETLDEVKFNAPRHYQTQERAITATDYKIMLKNRFPEINALAVYGGEKLNPPQYGRVFLAVDLFGFDGIPDYKKNEYKEWLNNKMPMTIEPVFIDPTFTFAALDLTIRYNQNKTDLTTSDISARVLDTVVNYSARKFNDFNVTVRFSKLMSAVDDTHKSILSSEAVFKPYKLFKPALGVTANYTIDFSFPVKNDLAPLPAVYAPDDIKSLTSSNFTYQGRSCKIEDDNDGNVRIVTTYGQKTHSLVTNLGKINYNTGTITLSGFSPDAYVGDGIKLYVLPRSNDVDFTRSDYFEIKEEDVNIDVIGIRRD